LTLSPCLGKLLRTFSLHDSLVKEQRGFTLTPNYKLRSALLKAYSL
jgi:hypothetical protein